MPPTWDVISTYAFLGLLVGIGYYLAPRVPTGWQIPAELRWLPAALNVLRIAAAIGFFLYLASLGGVPTLSAFAGFLVGRVLAFRLTGEDA